MTMFNGKLPHERQASNMNGNVCVAIDVETTGRVPGYHEIIQIGIQPLDADFRPLEGVKYFNHLVRPEHPERAETEAMKVSGLSLDDLRSAADCFQVADWMREWVKDLQLPLQRSLVPLAHGWEFEKGFLTDWLGDEDFGQFFFSHARDTMRTALFINDYAIANGAKAPFRVVNLPFLCEHFGIPHENAHDALADAISTAELYRRLIAGFGTPSFWMPTDVGRSDNPSPSTAAEEADSPDKCKPS